MEERSIHAFNDLRARMRIDLRKHLLVTAMLFPCLASGAHGPELDAILTDLARDKSPEASARIVSAIDASPPLTRRIDALAHDGALKRIVVVDRPVNGVFGAAANAETWTFTSSFLTALDKRRYFDVVRADDVLPDQTVFVLAHLAYHLVHPALQAKGTTPQAFVAARLRDEAGAFVDSWNATVGEAILRNGHALSNGQIATLLLNCRYRFALLGSKTNGIAAPHLEDDGRITASSANLDQVAATLERSPIVDLQ